MEIYFKMKVFYIILSVFDVYSIFFIIDKLDNEGLYCY